MMVRILPAIGMERWTSRWWRQDVSLAETFGDFEPCETSADDDDVGHRGRV
jgi:hypothetical protein